MVLAGMIRLTDCLATECRSIVPTKTERRSNDFDLQRVLTRRRVEHS